MKRLFYEEWNKKRLRKIINVFGEDWFAGKRVLELGACHGDLGIPLLKLGAQVTFTDLREINLNTIRKKVIDLNVTTDNTCEFKLLNQENFYKLDGHYDLVLHLGVLYHVKNWKQDLQCALAHAKYCILESAVVPDPSIDSNKEIAASEHFTQYCGQNGNRARFSAEAIENHLNSLGCKFIRFDNSELNTNISWDANQYIQNIYDWKFPNIMHYKRSVPDVDVYTRRLWLTIR